MFKSLPATPFKRCCLVAIVLANTLPVTGFVAQVAAASDTQRVFRGTLEQRFKPTQRLFNRSSVIFNADGYRLESLPENQGEVIIENTLLGKAWFVDNTRSLIHEVPLSDVEGAPELAEPVISMPGSINSIPCIGQTSTRMADVQYKGKTLERWTCAMSNPDHIDDDELPVEQYFSHEYGVVVYSRSYSNIETELMNVSEATVDSTLFTAPAGFRSVSIDEFLDEYDPLETYNDKYEQLERYNMDID